MRGALVVAAELEGLKDAVIPGRTGILLPPEDAGSWASELVALVADRTLLERRRVRFQEEARVLFSEEAMGQSLRQELDLAPEEGVGN
jgi:glycosyltransferase involved in cell wall biosynthesis